MLDLFKQPKFHFLRIFLRFIQPIFIRWHKLSAMGLENVPREGPFLLVSNHSHKLDYLFITAMMRRPMFHGMSNEHFRNPFTRRIKWAKGMIPIGQRPETPGVIRQMVRALKWGYPIGIYPEGGMNWDGKTLPVLEVISKFIKLCNVPVVAVVIKGNYLTLPRWANNRRKCPITLHFSKPVTFNRETPDEEVTDWVQKAIDNNDNYTEVEWIKGKHPADGLTRLLWRCPDCRALEGLQERNGNELVCTHCGKMWEVNLLCRMRAWGDDTWKPVKEYADLIVREEEFIPIQPDTTTFLEENEQVYIQSGDITLYNQLRFPKLKKVDDGRLYLTDRGLVFVKKSDGKSIRYPFNEIGVRSTEKNYIFQIGTKERQIARFEMPHESCLKWEICYDLIQYKSAER